MQDKLDTLDDDNRAIDNILRRDFAQSKSQGDEYDTKSSTKFAKSLKKMQQRPRDQKG